MIQSSKETLYSIDEVIKVKTNQISMDFMFIFSGANSVPWFTFDPSLADSATGLSPATLPTKGLGFFWIFEIFSPPKINMWHKKGPLQKEEMICLPTSIFGPCKALRTWGKKQQRSMDLDGFGISTILFVDPEIHWNPKVPSLTFRFFSIKNQLLEGVTAVIMVGVPSTAKDAKQLVDFISRCVSWRHGIIGTCGLIHGVSILDPVSLFFLGGSSTHPLPSPWKHGIISEVYGKLQGFILQDLKCFWSKS